VCDNHRIHIVFALFSGNFQDKETVAQV
jgi:hypothetical protein